MRALFFFMGYGLIISICGIILIFALIQKWITKKQEKKWQHNRDLKQAMCLINDKLMELEVGDCIANWTSVDYHYYRVEKIVAGEIYEDRDMVRVKTAPHLYATLLSTGVYGEKKPNDLVRYDLVDLKGYDENGDIILARNFIDYIFSCTQDNSRTMLASGRIKKIKIESIRRLLDSQK